MSLDSHTIDGRRARRGSIKCVVWDLDGTLWDGTLLEDATVSVKPDIIKAIRELSERGILHSIASRNDEDLAMERLVEAGVADHFVYPQIGWHAKSVSIAEIARLFNFSRDALAFVDDQPFELDEVRYSHPDVMCVAAADVVAAVEQWPEFRPRFVTDESRTRRLLYRSEERRTRDEAVFEGTPEEFLGTLNMSLTVGPASATDLKRAEELTIRTNQLNSTGRTYSFAELDHLRRDPEHLLLVASLEDRYGPYGTIGLALIARDPDYWTLRLLLVSCRVMSRGIGNILLHHVMRLARAAGAQAMRADFVDTGRNRAMYVAYRFAGFSEIARNGDEVLFESDLSDTYEPPPYVTLTAR